MKTDFHTREIESQKNRKQGNLKTFYIESRVTRIEYIEVQATDRKQALKQAEEAEARYWKTDGRKEERQLVSIS